MAISAIQFFIKAHRDGLDVCPPLVTKYFFPFKMLLISFAS